MKRKTIFIFLIITSLYTLGQNNQKNKSCFTQIRFENPVIWVGIPKGLNNLKLFPQKHYKGVLTTPLINYDYCYKNEEIKDEIKKIKKEILETDVENLSEQQQLIYLKQITIGLIWNHLFEIDESVYKINMNRLNKNMSRNIKIEFDLVDQLIIQKIKE